MAVDEAESVSQPLLRATPKDVPEGALRDDEPTWKQEAKQQLKLAAPIIGMNAVQFLLVLTSAAFVGHLGALQLASAQLATSLANALGHYLLVSFLEESQAQWIHSRLCAMVTSLHELRSGRLLNTWR